MLNSSQSFAIAIFCNVCMEYIVFTDYCAAIREVLFYSMDIFSSLTLAVWDIMVWACARGHLPALCGAQVYYHLWSEVRVSVGYGGVEWRGVEWEILPAGLHSSGPLVSVREEANMVLSLWSLNHSLLLSLHTHTQRETRPLIQRLPLRAEQRV